LLALVAWWVGGAFYTGGKGGRDHGLLRTKPLTEQQQSASCFARYRNGNASALCSLVDRLMYRRQFTRNFLSFLRILHYDNNHYPCF
jgi:hypothetical protein